MSNYITQKSFSEAETWVINASFFEADRVTPLDITGASVSWGLSTSRDGAVIFQANIGSGVNIIDAEAGRADIVISPLQHVAVTKGLYFHQAKITMPDGLVIIPFEGRLKVVDSIFIP